MQFPHKQNVTRSFPLAYRVQEIAEQGIGDKEQRSLEPSPRLKNVEDFNAYSQKKILTVTLAFGRGQPKERGHPIDLRILVVAAWC
jgi:hypothetical protein